MKTRLKKPFLIREKPNPDRDKKLRTSGNKPEVFYLVLTVLSRKLNAKSMECLFIIPVVSGKKRCWID
jgi:hypothetical protein